MSNAVEQVIDPQVNAPVTRRKCTIVQHGYDKEDIYGIRDLNNRRQPVDIHSKRDLSVEKKLYMICKG